MSHCTCVCAGNLGCVPHFFHSMWLKHPEAPTAFELENVGTTGARGLLTGSSTSIPLKRSSSSALPTPFMSSREFLSTGLQTSTNVKSRPYSAYPSSSPSTGKLPASKFGDAAKAASPAMRALMRIHLTHTVVFPSKNDNNNELTQAQSNMSSPVSNYSDDNDWAPDSPHTERPSPHHPSWFFSADTGELKRKHAHNVTPLTVFKLFTNYESDAPPPLHSSFAASIPSSWFTDIIATFVHEANVDFQQLSQHRLNERYVQYLTAADLFDLLYDPPVISSQTSPQQSSQNLAGTSSTTNVRASISLPSPSNVPPLNFAFLTPTSSTTTNMTHSKSMFTFDPSSVQNTGAAEPESKPKCDQTASPKWVEYLSFRKVPVGILQKLPAAFTAHSKPTAETIPSKPTPINTNGSNKPSLNKVIAATSASVASVSTSTSSSAFLTAPVHFTVVRAHWTPKHITLDQRRNKLPLRQVTSQSSSPHLRCVTYDGAPAASEFRVLPLSATHRNARLGHSAAKVAQHLQRSLPGAVSLRSLTLYFMVDPSDKCYLWYGHRLLLSATHDIESFAHALLTSPLNDLLISPQSGNPSTLVDAFGLGVKTPNLLCYECGRVVDRRLVSQTNVLFDNISGDDEQKQHAHSLIRRPSRLSTDGALVAPDSAAAVFSLPVNTDSTLMPSLSIESNHATQNTTGPSQPNGHLSIPTLETISEAAEFAYEIAIDHNDQLPASELIPSPVISSIAPLASTADTNSDVLPVVAEEAVEQPSIAPLVPETPDEHRHRTDPMLAEPDVWIGPAVVSTTGAVWVSLQPQSTSNFANRSPLPGSHHTDSNDLRVSPLPVMSPTQLRASLEVPHTARPANIDEDEVMEKLDRLRQEQERLELLLAQSKAKKQQRQHDSIKSTPSLKSPDIRSPKVDAPSSARKPRPASASTRSNAASTVTPKPRSTPLRPASSSSSRHSPAQSTTPTLIQTHSLPDQHLDMLALSPYAEKRFGLYLPRSRNSTLQGSTRISVSHSQHPAFQQHDLLLQQQQHQLLSSPIHLTSPLSDSPSTFAQSMTSTVTSPSPNLSQFQHLELAMALALASPWKHPGFAAFQ